MLPQKIIKRKKLPLVPTHDFLKNRNLDYVKDLILEKFKVKDYLNNDYLNLLLNNKEISCFKGHASVYQKSNANKIWMILNLELFLRKFT